MNINNLVRTNILTLKPYQSARKIGGKGKIWLNANEYPIKPHYKKIYNINLHRYPECQPIKLINKYAKYARVNPEQILVSRGADEGIELLIKTFCEPGKDAILCCPPTYDMYSVTANTFGVQCNLIESDKTWQLDLNKINLNLKNVKLIYICHPNNPTGNLINKNDLLNLLKIINNKAILVIDEAYIDFCPNASLVTLLPQYNNLVILRTLSKAFSLAGLRCGFTLANNPIIKLLSKVITPYPLPTPVTKIAEQALSSTGLKKIKKKIEMIKINRDFFIKNLVQYPCVVEIFPSFSNYILVRFHPKYQIFQNLWNQGIILRNQSYKPGLTNCVRITIGTIKECKKVLKAIKKICNKNI